MPSTTVSFKCLSYAILDNGLDKIFRFEIHLCLHINCYYTCSFGEHVTPIGLVPGLPITVGLLDIDGRREMKYLTRSNMHAASVLIMSGSKQRLTLK